MWEVGLELSSKGYTFCAGHKVRDAWENLSELWSMYYSACMVEDETFDISHWMIACERYHSDVENIDVLLNNKTATSTLEDATRFLLTERDKIEKKNE